MDTIYAPATSTIKAGVAVIRISGSKALDSLSIITKPSKELKPRYAYLLKLYNPHNYGIIDEALVLYFKAPHSFTGEDIVELHLHGGRAVISEVIECLSNIPGLRMASPGEFSKRAFLNGKMDLTQAEGLADLIDAETSAQAKMALRQKQGELGNLYNEWRENILTSLANIEAYIDFPDEDIPEETTKQIEASIENLINSITAHLNDNNKGEILRSGVNIAIIGPPNAGKSSLINLLVKRDVAIVSEHAGTTRDIIEVHLDLSGYPVILADTAGIRDGATEVESIGIEKALTRAKDADFRLIVLDAKDVKESVNLELVLPFAIRKNDILVINKIDLLNNTKELSIDIDGNKPIYASFKEETGMDVILKAIEEKVKQELGTIDGPVITRQRHRELLKSALSSLENFTLKKEIELAAEDLRHAAVSIGQITGRINIEEILDKIFSSFCIGK